MNSNYIMQYGEVREIDNFYDNSYHERFNKEFMEELNREVTRFVEEKTYDFGGGDGSNLGGSVDVEDTISKSSEGIDNDSVCSETNKEKNGDNPSNIILESDVKQTQETIYIEDSELSTSSIDLKDSEYNYDNMIKRINKLVDKQNEYKITNFNKVKENYTILYRGVNFSKYQYEHIDINKINLENENEQTRKKLKDKKHYKRRLCVKKHVDRTIEESKREDYKSFALDKFIQNNKNNTVEMFYQTFIKMNSFNEKNIGGYVHPRWHSENVEKLGKINDIFYGNTMISTSKDVNRAIFYVNLGNNLNYRKHKCLGLLHVFLFHKDKLDMLEKNKKAFDVDTLRREGTVKSKCAREGENKEIIFKAKIDSENYIGTIPYISQNIGHIAQEFAESCINKLEREKEDNNIKIFFEYFFSTD